MCKLLWYLYYKCVVVTGTCVHFFISWNVFLATDQIAIIMNKKVGLVQVRTWSDPKVRSWKHLALDPLTESQRSGPTMLWPEHSDLPVGSSPDPGT